MHGWWLLAAIPVIAVVVYDVVMTAISANGSAGPVSGPLTSGIWRALRRGARSPSSRRLTAAGPVVVVVLLGVWLLGLWLGWTLLFAADPGAIVDADTGAPADVWQRAYFAGFALYTLGVGDLVPVGGVWRLATVVATINGFTLLTLTVSYLIPVTSAVTDRRGLGITIRGLGATAQDVLEAAFDGRGFAPLGPHLRQLTPALAHAAQTYRSYPVVHAFHDPRAASALEPGLARLHEVLVLLDHVDPAHRGVDRPTLDAAMHAIEDVLDAAEGAVPTDGPQPEPLDLGVLVDLGVKLRDEPSAVTSARDGDRRAALAALVADSRWSWRGAVVR